MKKKNSSSFYPPISQVTHTAVEKSRLAQSGSNVSNSNIRRRRRLVVMIVMLLLLLLLVAMIEYRRFSGRRIDSCRYRHLVVVVGTVVTLSA